MRYLRRKADDFLTDWKSQKNRLPIVVKGARQIGKTETIRKFASENYKNVIEINFVTEPKYKAIIDKGFSAEEIIKIITLIDPSKEFISGETLIFFDEIQAFPEIATSLKFFYEDGRFDVICSGSLLGIQYNHIASISVGYKLDYPMHSMDFEEFLWAKGYGKETMEEILEHMLSGEPFSEIEYRIYSDLFLDYCILGGMPNIVSKYIEYGNFQGSLMLQRQLLIDYESDVRKYAEGLDQARIIKTYRSIPAQLAKENSTLEMDFFIRSANELIPVEIKARTNQAKSLKQLIQSSHYPDIKHGIKFHAGNIGNSDLIHTFPFFCVFLLKRFMQETEYFD